MNMRREESYARRGESKSDLAYDESNLASTRTARKRGRAATTKFLSFRAGKWADCVAGIAGPLKTSGVAPSHSSGELGNNLPIGFVVPLSVLTTHFYCESRTT